MKVLIKSAWGSDDPTKAAFAFLHANAFAEAGHEVQIFLLGEAVSLMKDELIGSVTSTVSRGSPKDTNSGRDGELSSQRVARCANSTRPPRPRRRRRIGLRCVRRAPR